MTTAISFSIYKIRDILAFKLYHRPLLHPVSDTMLGEKREVENGRK